MILLFKAIPSVRNLEHGFFCLLFAVLSGCITDIFAYMIGKSIGKHKLCPVISPKKTVEGSIGGVVGNGIYGVTGSYGVSGGGSSVLAPGVSLGGNTTLLPNPIAFTKYSKDFCLSNGAVGRISIPAIGISRYYVWEGETSSSMSKGVAHFSSTSVWDGNVGICGHNRGAKYVIGDIKELEPGDKITYTTSEGTRTYEVETVTTIRNDDWSYLKGTSDNRITLITCVKDDSSHRWCVQAVEVD